MLCMFSSDCVKTNIKWKVFWFLFFPHIFQKAATIWGIGFNTRIIWFVAFFFSSNESHYGFIFMSERGQHSISVKELWYYTRNNNTEIVLCYERLRAIILFF